MRRTFKHFITPVTILFAIQMSVACADDARVTIESSSHVSAEQTSTAVNGLLSEKVASIYGPTKEDETLWSIAKAYRPEKSVSVAQTVLATYKLNSKAFEDHNIHGLIPGSILRLPTLTAIQQESTKEAVEIIQRDKLRPIPSQVDTSITPPKPAILADYSLSITEVLPQKVLGDDSSAETNSLSEGVEAKEESTSVANITEIPQSESVVKSKLASEPKLADVDQVEEMNTRLTSELGKIQQQLKELKTSIEAEEKNRIQTNEIEPKSTSIDTPQAFIRIANQHPWLWFIILLPVVLILFIIRLLFTRKPQRSEELERLVAPQKDVTPAMLVVDSVSTPDQPSSEAEAEAEAETLEFSDEDLPEYGEEEARQDADTEPQAFEANIPKNYERIIEDDIDNNKFDEALEFDRNSTETNPNDSKLSESLLDESAEIAQKNSSEAEIVYSSKIETTPAVVHPENIDEIGEPDLNVGLDEFPDVLGDVNDFDVDINSEMNSNLDLAKVFIEMGDERTATKLLKTVLSKGDDTLKAEANKLLSSI